MLCSAYAARTKLVLTSTEVIVYNWVRTRHVPWREIDTITVDPRQGIRVLRHDGGVVEVENPAPSTANIVTGRGKRFARYEAAIDAAQPRAPQ